MKGINKVLVAIERTYKVVDADGNEIGEIKERLNPKSGKRSYSVARMISCGNYIILGVYGTERTAMKHLLGED